MSDSIAHKLWLVKEVTFGVAVVAPVLTYVRNIGCTLALTKEGFESEEARADRAVADYRHGNRSVGGDLSIEFSYGSFDNLLEAVYCGADWALQDPFTDTDVSAMAADDSYNSASESFPVFAPGEIVTVSGFLTGANNGARRVLSSTAAKLRVLAADGTAVALTDEAAGENVEIQSDAEMITTGATRRSFNALRQFTDQSGSDKPFHLFTGCMVNAFNVTVAPGGNIKASFTLIGKDLDLAETGPGGATYGDPTATRVFDSFTGFLYEGGDLMAHVTEIQYKIENGFEAQFVCFDDSTIDPSIGTSRVSGQIGVHFRNSAMMEKFLNETPSELVFNLTDKDGNSYLFHLPRVIYNGGQPDTAAKGSIILTMPFMAIYDAASATQARLFRLPAA